MIMNLKVKIGKMELATPLVCASGTFGFGEELKGLVDFKNIGAITTKTITFLPRTGNVPPRIYETECGVINSVGLENPGLEEFIKEKMPRLRRLPTAVIISVGGSSPPEYIETVKELNKVEGVPALEINLSCPNIKNKKIISQDRAATYETVKSLRAVTDKALIIKITPEVSDIVPIANAVEEAGADAVSLVNTFLAMAINTETQKSYLGSIYGGYSGRAIKPLSLYRVWRVCQNIKIPVIGGGGIETAQDAIEFILAGATAISLGTVNLVQPNCARDILAGIKDYMLRKGIKDINELRGGLCV